MILHIFVADKFVQPFIGFVNDNFEPDDHTFYVINKKNKFKFSSSPNLILKTKFRIVEFLELSKMFQKADKVILHGLFWNSIIFLLAIHFKSLKKCFWVIWGGDLYKFYDRKKNLKSRVWHKIRFFVISRIGYFITYLPGDYQYAKEWYGAKGEVLECIAYLSNVFQEIPLSNFDAKDDKINILLGNSATAANRHENAFHKLLKFKDQINLIVPLSYGNEKYSSKIKALGHNLFGSAFVPLLNFMPIKEYYEILSTVNTVIFNHDRQQGMGNIIQLIGSGKKVFIDFNTPQYQLFKKLGIQVYDVENINLEELDSETKKHNKEIIQCYFSSNNLKKQLEIIFEKKV